MNVGYNSFTIKERPETMYHHRARANERREETATNAENSLAGCVPSGNSEGICVMKTCNKCHEIKPLAEFYKDRTRKDGLAHRCKPCCNEYARDWTERNPDRVRHAAREWVQNNPERVKATRRRYTRSDHGKKKMNETRRKYMRTEKGRAQRRKNENVYYVRHPERVKARNEVKRQAKLGCIPRACDLPCQHCGGVSHGYHHHKGYSLEFALDVIPLCLPCHRKADANV